GYEARPHLGPIVTSDVFYDPEEDPQGMWNALGVLAVEMEAASIFTISAMKGIKAGCLLTVSDTIGIEVTRIGDDELRKAVDDMTALALDTLNALD
ncbi:MAG: purine-nucleoside phosphorylase, partial [Rubrobacter sp.]|nr:purine-nucleoside phosphorylase [Rubrobacter sp.]